jgi:hypothetical protein
MNENIKYAILLSFTLILSGCSWWDSLFKEKEVSGIEKTIKIFRVKYRTGNAPIAVLGSVGYVSGLGIGGGANTFDHKRTPKYDIKIKNDGIITQDFTQNSSSYYQGNIEGTIAQKIDAKASLDGRSASKVEKQVFYHLLSVESSAELVDDMNSPKGKKLLTTMKNGGETSRFVTQIIIAFGYKSSKLLELSGNAKLLLKSGKLEIGDISIAKAEIDTKLGFDTRVTNKISLSDGMIVGYTYDAACWGGNTSSGNVEIITSVLSKYGKNPDCPTGVTDPLKALKL